MILEEEEYRAYLVEASSILANAVSTTFGTMGANVLIDTGGETINTKDGVTVADFVTSDDPATRVLINTIKKVSQKTLDEAGDGTTTSIILVDELIQNSIRKFDKYTSVFQMKAEIEKAVEHVTAKVRNLSTPISDGDTYKIALTSSNSDEEIANTIVTAFELAGDTGMVGMEANYTGVTEIKTTSGFKMDFGYMDERFLPHDATKIDLEDIKIHVFKGRFTGMSDIPTFNQNEKCVIVAQDFSPQGYDEILRLTAMRKVIIPLRIPFISDRAREVAGDLCAYIGEDCTVESISIGVKETLVIKKDAKIEGRTKLINAEIKATTDKVLIEYLMSRVSNLSSCSVTIQIGCESNLEYSEKQDRYDDAIKAVKASMKGGYIAGGGTTLNYVAEQEKEYLMKTKGGEIVYESLSAPLRALLSNANISFNERRGDLTEYGIGINLKDSSKKCNMITELIIDPTLVTITALKSASSVACQLISTKKFIL